MAEDILLTPELRVDVNGLPISTVSGNVRVTADMVNKTGTEDTSSRVKKSPLRKAAFQITIQREPDPGYHATLIYNLQNQAGCWVRIWHAGRADVDQADDFPTVVFGEEANNWNMANSSAQEIQLTGESDGDFILAGE